MTTSGHTFIVCGASSTLATAIIERVVNENVTLVATYRTRELSGSRWPDRIERRATWMQVDVTNEADVQELMARIADVPEDHRVTLLYCCGRWTSGPVGADSILTTPAD